MIYMFVEYICFLFVFFLFLKACIVFSIPAFQRDLY